MLKQQNTDLKNRLKNLFITSEIIITQNETKDLEISELKKENNSLTNKWISYFNQTSAYINKIAVNVHQNLVF